MARPSPARTRTVEEYTLNFVFLRATVKAGTQECGTEHGMECGMEHGMERRMEHGTEVRGKVRHNERAHAHCEGVLDRQVYSLAV